jgi:hypothetical protein
MHLPNAILILHSSFYFVLFYLVISGYEANNTNNSHGTGIFRKIVSELLYRENTEGRFLYLKHIMEFLRKKVLALGRVQKLPEQMTRATKFPMVVPNIGLKLTSCYNYGP